MSWRGTGFWQGFSIQTKMLVIILPLIVEGVAGPDLERGGRCRRISSAEDLVQAPAPRRRPGRCRSWGRRSPGRGGESGSAAPPR